MNDIIKYKNRTFIYVAVLVSIFFISIINIPDESMGIIYLKNYIYDAVYLIACVAIFGWGVCRDRVGIFSPITILSLIYITMFFVTPMYDISINNLLWFGNDLFYYGIKASGIAFIGYLSFCLFYFFEIRLENKYTASKQEKEYVIFNCEKLILIILIGYFFCLVCNIYYLVVSNGNSILYIFTLGMMGSSGLSTGGDVGAISMFSYALPSFTLLYMEYGKNRFCKVTFFYLMFILQVARGFRFFIIQIIIMFGAYYFIRNGKKPKLKDFLILSVCLMVPVLLMTLFRYGIRNGDGMNLSIINGKVLSDAFEAAFWENLRIYKTYYGIIKAVPELTSYLYGKQIIIYTLIMFIPRAIWPGKPGNPGTKAQLLSLGRAAVVGGSAYPCLGEYYYEFGVLGVILFMGIFGAWLSNVEKKSLCNIKSPIEIMIYCTILGLILQFVIRGYTPSNFWMYIFCMLPFWMIKKSFAVSKE